MPNHLLLVSVAAFAKMISADDKSVRRGLQSGVFPLRVHRIGGLVRLSITEAEAWITEGCPSRDAGWLWPKPTDTDSTALRIAPDG